MEEKLRLCSGQSPINVLSKTSVFKGSSVEVGYFLDLN